MVEPMVVLQVMGVTNNGRRLWVAREMDLRRMALWTMGPRKIYTGGNMATYDGVADDGGADNIVATTLLPTTTVPRHCNRFSHCIILGRV